MDRKQSLQLAKDLLALYDSVGHVSQQFYSRVCFNAFQIAILAPDTLAEARGFIQVTTVVTITVSPSPLFSLPLDIYLLTVPTVRPLPLFFDVHHRRPTTLSSPHVIYIHVISHHHLLSHHHLQSHHTSYNHHHHLLSHHTSYLQRAHDELYSVIGHDNEATLEFKRYIANPSSNGNYMRG